MAASKPLNGTYITSLADGRLPEVIHIFYQDDKNYLVQMEHNDKNPNEAPEDPQRELIKHSPLGSAFGFDPDDSAAGPHVYAAPRDLMSTKGANYEIFQKIPDYRHVAPAAEASKLGAMYDGNIFVCYQKPGEQLKNTIFEKNLTDKTEQAVCVNALEGANLSVYAAFGLGSSDRSPQASENTGQLPAVCGGRRYMVYNGMDGYLWLVCIGSLIERVQNIKLDDIKPNTPVAIIGVLDLLAVYYLNKDNQIFRILRGTYSWGRPKFVIGVNNSGEKTNLAVSRDITRGERVVWLSYQDRNDAITGVHDVVKADE